MSELQLDRETRARLRALIDERRRQLVGDEPARPRGEPRGSSAAAGVHGPRCRCDDCCERRDRHGSTTRYRHGCRCDDCRAAVAAERLRSKRRARQAASGGR